MPLLLRIFRIIAAGGSTDALLLEDDFYILLETGDRLLLE